MKTYDELKALIELRGVHPELGPVGEGFNIEQSPHELATFLVRMQDLNVHTCLEIGTGYKGGLSRFLAQEMGWTVSTIDVQDYELNYPDVRYWLLLPDGTLARHLGQKGYFRQSIAAFQRSGEFDLVFIDGAHDYASVKRDYETYGKLATKVIAFHDIEGLRDCEGAKRFWEELAVDPNSEMFGHMKPNHHFTTDEQWDYPAGHPELKPECKPAGIGWIELE